jgi:DNA-binding transcriptional LysR family regulator
MRRSWSRSAHAVQYRFDLGYDGRVSLQQVRYFVAVAEEAHVGRAAARLHVSQPPLSRQIRALEEELGAPLFERTARGMRLLPRGQVFLGHARRILACVDEATRATRATPSSDRADERAP